MIKKIKSVSLSMITALMILNQSQLNPVTAESGLPKLSGRLLYHSYNSYGDGTSELFIFNFKTNELECISQSWTNVKDPMNAVWTDDGKAIVFMGMNTVDPIWEFYSWDIFYYEVGSDSEPVNLTNDPWSRCEDPKIIDGQNNSIVYKAMEIDCNYVRKINLGDEITIDTLYEDSEVEPAMPFYMVDQFYFSGLDKNGEMDIYKLNSSADGYISEKVAFCSEPNVFEYYPVLSYDSDWFFYAAHTDSDPVDYLYMGSLNGQESILMPFNLEGCDTADPCTVNYNYTITSSIRPNGKGGYDLYLCDNFTGETFPINAYNSNINTDKNELAAWYTPTNPAANNSEDIRNFILNKPCNINNVYDLDNNSVIDAFDIISSQR